MSDAILQRQPDAPWDFQIGPDGDILTTDFYDTAILISLYEQKRASESEIPRPELRSGWIGNEATPDFERGSKIWLYKQKRLTRSVINAIIAAAHDGLAWMVDQGFALSIVIDVQLNDGATSLAIDLQRTDGTVESKLIQLWDQSGITETK